MPGRGRPKKCARKLNFKKDGNLSTDTIRNEENILLPVSENDDIQNDVIPIHNSILPESSLEQAPSDKRTNIYETINLTEKEPVPLRNNMRDSENVCFFNSVVQVLFSLIPFRARILSDLVDNQVIRNIKQLFRTINESVSSYSIHTYPVVRAIDIPHYIDHEQIDALEVLRYLIDNSVETNQTTGRPDYSFFKVAENTSTLCAQCNKETHITDYKPMISLDIEASQRLTINDLLSRKFFHGYSNPDYRCERREDENGNVNGCNELGKCTISHDLTVPGEFLIIQLKVFAQDNYGRRTKLFPDVIVNQELHLFDEFDLQGIIWHHGQSCDNGHYTSNVKANGVWHHTNDYTITQREMFRTIGEQVPYIIVYKKRNVQITPNTNRLNTAFDRMRNDEIDEIPMETEYYDHDSNQKSLPNDENEERMTIDDEETHLNNVDKPDKTDETSNVENAITKTNYEEQMILDDKEPCFNDKDDIESVDEIKPRTYNFSKERARFSTKN